MVGEETNNIFDESGALETVAANHFTQDQAAPLAQPGRATERFLWLSGALSFALGATIAMAPDAVPELGRVAQRLAGMGISPAVMLMVGVGLFGLGMLAHTFTSSIARVGSSEPHQEHDSDFMLVADQLATDMAQTLSTLLQISSEIAELSENNRTLLRNMPDASGQKSNNQTQLFQLASSVDKLCASVDSRLSNMGIELNASMQGVTTSLSQVRGQVESASQKALVSAAPQAGLAQQEPEAPAALPHPMDEEPSAKQSSSDLPEPQFENPALDIFDQMAENNAEESSPAAPFSAPQGVDELDDLMPK